MKPITASTVVERPRADVFASIERLEAHESFTDHFLTDWVVIADGHVAVRAGGERLDVRVVESVAPERTVERTVGAGGRRVTRGTYTLTELGPGRTHVLFELAFEQVPAAERIAAPFVRAWLRRNNRRALERLREQLETPGGRAQEAVAGA